MHCCLDIIQGPSVGFVNKTLEEFIFEVNCELLVQ